MSLVKRPSTTSEVSDVIGIDLGTTNSVVAVFRYGHVDVIASTEGLS
jgi:molecular chaperone DnaK (HSP70)